MPITRFTVSLDETMRERLMRVGTLKETAPRIGLWLAFTAASGALAVAAFFVIANDNAISVIGGALMLIFGVVFGVFSVVALFGGLAMRAGERRERLDADAALAKNEMQLVEIDADAAWSAHAIDDDAPSVLLRAGPDRFIYLNSSDLHDVIQDIESDPEHQHIASAIRVIRCPPWQDPAAIERRDDATLLEIADDLPGISGDELSDCLASGESADTLAFAVLTLDQLPAAWQEFLSEPQA
jgi:hypothetical protein